VPLNPVFLFASLLASGIVDHDHAWQLLLWVSNTHAKVDLVLHARELYKPLLLLKQFMAAFFLLEGGISSA
jgi:hypothetical protein